MMIQFWWMLISGTTGADTADLWVGPPFTDCGNDVLTAS